jgi:hypothetical protein
MCRSDCFTHRIFLLESSENKQPPVKYKWWREWDSACIIPKDCCVWYAHHSLDDVSWYLPFCTFASPALFRSLKCASSLGLKKSRTWRASGRSSGSCIQHICIACIIFTWNGCVLFKIFGSVIFGVWPWATCRKASSPCISWNGFVPSVNK